MSTFDESSCIPTNPAPAPAPEPPDPYRERRVALAAGLMALIIPRQVSLAAPLAAQAAASTETPAVPLVEP